jgi:hypothetical protein
MTPAMLIYKENIGHTHEFALQAVWDAAFKAGVASVAVKPKKEEVKNA